MTLPWQDRLARAKAGPSSQQAPQPAPAQPSGRTAGAPESLAAVAPGLRALMQERSALERQMAQLTGSPAADPRYPVTPLDERRADFARWSTRRDSPAIRARRAADARGPAAEPRQAAYPEPPLRPTPGEEVPAGQVPAAADRWFALRDALRSDRSPAGALTDAGRALGMGSGDPLDRRLEKARDLASKARRTYASSQQALSSARDAIDRDWTERIEKNIPSLDQRGSYVRDTARKLGVDVGSLEEMGAKSQRLREQAGALRDLKRADENNDDTRRQQALERLQARKKEERTRARKESTDA